MYIPKKFHTEDLLWADNFLQTHNFGVIVSQDIDGKLLGTHIPFLVARKDKEFILTGHFSRANTQWNIFDSDTENSKEVLCIFQGYHSYISSDWYEKPSVPTWNYESIHIYGKIELLDTTEYPTVLESLIKFHDNTVEYHSISDKMLEGLLKGIVCFRVISDRVEMKRKLSQNKSLNEKQNIINQLRETEGENAQKIADIMDKLYFDKK